MGEPVPISLGLRSNPARRNKQAGSCRHINCFAEEVGEEGKSLWNITAIPGLANFGSALSGGGIRAMLPVGDKLIVLAGAYLYSVNASGVGTLIGGIPTTGAAYMRRNRRAVPQVGIVSDGYYAVYTVGGLTVEISDPDLAPPTSLAYLDGYGVLPGPRGTYKITGIDDFSTIDGLDEGATDTLPDEIERAHELGREVYFLGTDGWEAHQNTGDEDFPFTRSQSGKPGCLAGAGGSVAECGTEGDSTLCFVANDHTVRTLRGYQASVVSTPEISELIRALADAGRTSELKGTAWTNAGRFFYALSCADWTRVLDLKTGGWHERKSYGLDRWRVSEVVSFAGKTIAGDYATGQLYEMRDGLYDEAGNPLVMEIISPPVHGFPYRFRHNALFIDAAVGVGLNTSAAQNLDPVMMVDYSHDGGLTFSTPIEVALGRLGQNARRLPPLRRLGMSGANGRSYRFRISADVEKLVMGVALDADKLAA